MHVQSVCFLSVAVITCASHAQGRRFEPGRKHLLLLWFVPVLSGKLHTLSQDMGGQMWSYGVMVSTLDFESSDPSSNLGRT